MSVKGKIKDCKKTLLRINEKLKDVNGLSFFEYRKLICRKLELKDELKLLHSYLHTVGNKNNLGKGDKFIDIYNAKVEIITIEYCEEEGTNKYFGKDENGRVDVWTPEEVSKILGKYGGIEVE